LQDLLAQKQIKHTSHERQEKCLDLISRRRPPNTLQGKMVQTILPANPLQKHQQCIRRKRAGRLPDKSAPRRPGGMPAFNFITRRRLGTVNGRETAVFFPSRKAG
jgi:hypothetical protein